MVKLLQLTKTLQNFKSAFICLFLLGAFTNNLKAQYCSTSYGNGTSSGDYISLVEFVGTPLNNPSAGSGSPYYTFFPNTGSTTASLTIGTQYTLNLSGGTFGSCYIGIWGDWDHDGNFSSSEFMGLSSNVGNTTTSAFPGGFIIPNNALAGPTRIRFRSSDTSPGPSSSHACGFTNSGYGETEDYEITVLPLPSCSGTPFAGSATTSNTFVCSVTPFVLSLSGNTLQSGMTYQWQSSFDGTNWNNEGAAQIGWTKSITNFSSNTQYRCITTCTSSLLSDTSTVVNVYLKPALDCYCTPPTFNCNNEKFLNFSLANVAGQLVNCDANGFSDSTMSNYTSVNLIAGNSYTLSTDIYSSGFSGDAALGYWIDFDHNRIFDSYEFTSLGSGPTGTYTKTLTVPFTSPGGSVRMRLMLDGYYGYSGTVLTACSGNSGIGQVVDYKVNITPAPACSLTPNAGNAIATSTSICENTPFTIDLNGNDLVSGISYQWQSSLNGSTWNNLGSSQMVTSLVVPTQSITTYYRCILTCLNSSVSATSTPVMVTQNLPTACYCQPDVTYCTSVGIYSVSISNLNYSPTCNYTDGYTNYSDSVASINLNAGQTYTLLTAVTTFSDSPDGHVSAWIDYDQNGVFDNYEFTSVASFTSGVVSTSITVPFTSPGGNTRMRIKLERNSGFHVADPCASTGSSDGQTLDYLVNITPAPPCSAIPNAGNAVSSFSAICENVFLKLNLENNDQVSNMVYQWQASTDNVSWTILGGFQSVVPYSISSQSVTTYYRCVTTCLNSSLSSTSTPVTVTQNPYTACYCVPEPMDCSSDNIHYVNFSTLTNTSTCGTNGYEDFTSSVASPTVNPGQTYTLTTALGYSYGENVSAWIDYNHNGVFDDEEYTYLGSNSGNDTIQNTITIPQTALLGTVRMRIRNFSGGQLFADDACISPMGGGWKQSVNDLSSFGETEDYLITILPPDCGTVNIPNQISVSGATVNCGVQLTNLDLIQSLPYATGFTYNWMSSTGGNFTSEGTYSISAISLTPSTTSYYSCNILCNGTSVLKSDTITVVVDLLTASVSSTSVTCQGACDGSAIANITGGSGAFVYFWTPLQAYTPTVTALCPGNYSVMVTDANGCTAMDSVTITEPVPFNVSISGNSTSICEQLEDTLTSTLSGGVAPFNYSWLELPSSVISSSANYEYTTSVGTYSYNLSVTDANACVANSNTLVISVNPSSNFSGMVTTYPSVPVAGRVILYKYLPFFTKFDSVAGQTIAPDGSFLFNSFTSGTYIIKAIPTATNMQVTYGDSAVNWKTAKQIQHGCAVDDVQNINVKPLGTFTTTGNGLLSGQIREGNGFGQRMGTGFKPSAPGNPIGGIIVKGGKNPGGQMLVQTVTDTAGGYVLSGLPPNNAGESYFILVDIPGLDTNGTYDGLIINVSNSQYTNLDFIVDSAKINPVSAVSVNDLVAKENGIIVFPNPAANVVNVRYTLKNKAAVKIELFDIFGRQMQTVLNENEQPSDTHFLKIPLNHLAAGIYFMNVNINGAASTVKLFVTQ
ncbi:MAG: hypothetical protein K0R26_1045 [Bacteroidota bacterium]|jgi:hypothetical protein|nr:hypothetical protein [Bacteroidota bacterium]